MKKHLIFTLLLFIGVYGYGQDIPDAFANRINHIFQYVDKSQIPTGILQEYGIDFTNINNYNGLVLNDSNKLTLAEWRHLYNSLYSAQINNTANMPTPDVIKANQANFTASSLMVMHYHFNQLKPDALTNNLFTVSNDQLYDVSGRPQSPYQQESAFAISPINAISETELVTLVFKQELFYSNTGKTVSALYLDPGSGYQQAYWDVPKTFMLDSIGLHTMKAKIVYTDASVYESHFVVYVNSITGNSLMGGGGMQPMYTAPWPDEEIAASRVHSGTAAIGTIQVRISAQNNNQLKKPLIIAEGFDPWNVIGGRNMDINSFLDDMVVQQYNLRDNLDLAGYDIVYLDYAKGTDYIQNNAYLLQDVIKWVNDKKTLSGSTEPNVVLGVSMGGLVARWAIKDMEDRSEAHQVRLNISMDSPHNGAYIPLAAQALVSGTHDFKIKAGFVVTPFKLFSFDEFDNFNNLLNTPAARQMLTYQTLYNPLFGNFTDFSSPYNTFMSAYHTKGLPALCENMAISNGSSCGTSQSVAPGDYYLNINETSRLDWGEKYLLFMASPWAAFTNYPKFALSGLLGFLPNKTTLSTQVKVRALGNNQNLEIYKAQIGIKRKIFGLINVNTYVINQSYSSGSRLPLDSAPGGGYDISAFTGGGAQLQGQLLQTGFGYIPTVSALDLSTNISNFTYSDLVFPYRQNNTSSYPKATPFSAVKVGFRGNEEHTDFSLVNATWLYNKLEGIVNDDCPSYCPSFGSMNITGPSASSTYTANNLPVGSTVSWQVDAPYTINGSITANPVGIVIPSFNTQFAQLVAHVNTGCGIFPLTKTLVPPAITTTLTSSGGICGEGIAELNVPNGANFIWRATGDVNIEGQGQYYATTSNMVNITGISGNISVSFQSYGNTVTTGHDYQPFSRDIYVSMMGGGSIGATIDNLDFSFDNIYWYIDNDLVETGMGSLYYNKAPCGEHSVRAEVDLPCGTRVVVGSASFSEACGGWWRTMVVYPNPASSYIAIAPDIEKQKSLSTAEKSKMKEYEASLYDVKGKLLLKGRSSNFKLQLDTRKLKSNYYYLHIRMDGDKEVIKQQVIIRN